MNPKQIFTKTARGQNEIRTRSAGLSMQHRRVLILANGRNDVRELTRLSRNENTIDILVSLRADGYIKASSDPDSTVPAQDYALAE